MRSLLIFNLHAGEYLVGGTDPIVSHGHRKQDARRIRDLIEGFQQGRTVV